MPICKKCQLEQPYTLFPIKCMENDIGLCYPCLLKSRHEIRVPSVRLDEFYSLFGHFQRALRAAGIYMDDINEKDLSITTEVYEITSGFSPRLFVDPSEQSKFAVEIQKILRPFYAFQKNRVSTCANGPTHRYKCHRYNRIRDQRQNEIKREMMGLYLDKESSLPHRVVVRLQNPVYTSLSSTCNGTLNIEFNLKEEFVRLVHFHVNHCSTEMHGLDMEQIRCLESYFDSPALHRLGTPGAIQPHLGASGITKNQIAQCWNKTVRAHAAAHKNPIISFFLLMIGNYSHFFEAIPMVSRGYYGVALLNRHAVSHLKTAEELLLDSIPKIDSLGAEMFAVVAPVDHVGCTVGYLIMYHHDESKIIQPEPILNMYTTEQTKLDPNTLLSQARSYFAECFGCAKLAESELAYEKPRTGALAWMLSELKRRGFNPAFIGVDQDEAQINGAKRVFGSTCAVQYSMWHGSKSILSHAKSRATLNHQRLQQYAAIAPSSVLVGKDTCWSREALMEPHQRHQTSACEHGEETCRFSPSLFESETFLSTDDCNKLLALINQHAMSVPNMPGMVDDKVVLTSKEDIVKKSVKSMFDWCMNRNLVELWMYLWSNWYCEGHREYWLPVSIQSGLRLPNFSTTLCLESSHNRLMEFLRVTGQSRMDEICYIICDIWMPREVLRLFALLHDDRLLTSRIAVPTWRSDCVREIRLMVLQAMEFVKDGNYQKLERTVDTYLTDPLNFICGCAQYTNCKRRVCHHILAFYDLKLFEKEIPDQLCRAFYSEVKFCSTAPYWRHPLLKIKPHAKPYVRYPPNPHPFPEWPYPPLDGDLKRLNIDLGNVDNGGIDGCVSDASLRAIYAEEPEIKPKPADSFLSGIPKPVLPLPPVTGARTFSSSIPTAKLLNPIKPEVSPRDLNRYNSHTTAATTTALTNGSVVTVNAGQNQERSFDDWLSVMQRRENQLLELAHVLRFAIDRRLYPLAYLVSSKADSAVDFLEDMKRTFKKRAHEDDENSQTQGNDSSVSRVSSDFELAGINMEQLRELFNSAQFESYKESLNKK